MTQYDLKALLEKLRAEKPLVHNITNYVVMNFTANVLLAMGASPVMAHAIEEVEEMASISKALVINIGTLSRPWIDAMIAAGKKANQIGVPVILDPVGSGATKLRTETFKRLAAEIHIAVVRGNPSEVLSIGASAATTKGVDSLHAVDQAMNAAQALAREIGAVVAITGPVDLVTNGREVVRCGNGHALMGSITGTGCSATATIGAFAGVTRDSLEAAAAGLAFFGLAGEVAASHASAPGSFMIALLDALHTITPEKLRDGARLSGE